MKRRETPAILASPSATPATEEMTYGLFVERNQIRNNAPRIETQDPPRRGARGGVFVLLALAPTEDFALEGGEFEELFPRQTGTPALRISDNSILVQEGRCLAARGMGAWLVTDNNLTTHGLGTGDVGADPEGGLGEGTEDGMNEHGGVVVYLENRGKTNESGEQLEDWLGMGDVEIGEPLFDMSSSGVLIFADNQVLLDLLGTGAVAAPSAVYLESNDDVGVNDNHIACYLRGDQIGANLSVSSWTVRVTGNRLEEALRSSPDDSTTITEGLSGRIVGNYGVVSDNVATHCLIILGAMVLKTDNVEIVGGCE